MIVEPKVAFDIEEKLVTSPPGKQIGVKGGNIVLAQRVGELDGGFVFTQCQSDEPSFAELPIHTERQAVGSEFHVIGRRRVPLCPVSKSSQPNAVLFLGIAVRSFTREHWGNVQEQDGDKEKNKGTHSVWSSMGI